ncbi:MAG: metallophosphoesterase family protein [Candidatus Atribacteria bacterium]|nr:metallophosphoesterase family protein [Candidatus Atribacteria bacterium]
MTRITVLSDTHIPKRAKDIPQRLWEEIKQTNLVLHAGDVVLPLVLEKIAQYAPIRAVRGNMDPIELLSVLPDYDLIEVEGVKIGLTHGQGAPNHVKPYVRSLFKGYDLQVVIFGHSHQPELSNENGVWYLNPGSPTDPFFAPYLSYARMEIDKGRIIDIKIQSLA